MPSLSYKGRFVDYVEAGLNENAKPTDRIKRQTIRNFRKYPVKPGDTLYHYYAQRTKWCRKLGESICKSADQITIRANSVRIKHANGVHIITNKGSLDAFAYADGFANWREMIRWWKLTHGPKCFPFTGQLIMW
jgi:hypothetical protein